MQGNTNIEGHNANRRHFMEIIHPHVHFPIFYLSFVGLYIVFSYYVLLVPRMLLLQVQYTLLEEKNA